VSDNDLGDFFNLLKTAKTEDPLHRAIQSARKRVEEVFSQSNRNELIKAINESKKDNEIIPENPEDKLNIPVKLIKETSPFEFKAPVIDEASQEELMLYLQQLKFEIKKEQEKTDIHIDDISNDDSEISNDLYKEIHQELETKLDNETVPSHDDIMSQIQKQLQPSKLSGSIETKKEMPITSQYDLDIIQKKIQKMEVYLQNLSMMSPGSGEVKLINLDDVDRYLVSDEPNQIILYNPREPLKTCSFRMTSQLDIKLGGINSIRFNENARDILSYELEQYSEDLDPNSLDDNYSLRSFSVDAVPGSILWNSYEDCLDIHHKDGTILQTGLENFIQVKNNFENETLENGMFVRFGGVNGEIVPYVIPFVADGSVPPLHSIGLLTQPIEPGKIGRATIIGKVRGLNTTGIEVGEDWSIGDVLWGHPTLPGKLTNKQPTAPDVAIAVAVVLHRDEYQGVLLVRPAIFPRLYYGDFFDTTQQTALVNTATPVYFNQTTIASGMNIDPNDKSKIIINHAGLYNFMFSLQVTSLSSARNNVWIWYRKNGIDVPNSASNLTIDSNGGKLIPSWNFVVSMNPNDTFQLFWATDSDKVSLDAPPPTSFCPSTPSAIINVSQINL